MDAADGYKDVSQVDQVIVQKIGLEARRAGGELLESFEDLCAPKRVSWWKTPLVIAMVLPIFHIVGSHILWVGSDSSDSTGKLMRASPGCSNGIASLRRLGL